MRRALALLLLGLSTAASGCALIEDGSRNFYVSFARPLEARREKARNREWAEAAWVLTCGRERLGIYSPAYALGFKEGFAEYLYRGGDGEPPLVAPLHYHEINYQTPEGFTSIKDWFAGYRHGAAVARSSGARDVITGPSSLQVAHPVPPGPEAPPPVPARPTVEAPELQTLPSPKVLPDETSDVLPKGLPDEANDVPPTEPVTPAAVLPPLQLRHEPRLEPRREPAPGQPRATIEKLYVVPEDPQLRLPSQAPPATVPPLTMEPVTDDASPMPAPQTGSATLDRLITVPRPVQFGLPKGDATAPAPAPAGEGPPPPSATIGFLLPEMPGPTSFGPLQILSTQGTGTAAAKQSAGPTGVQIGRPFGEMTIRNLEPAKEP
jgi:hypothetical protein